MAVAMRTVTLKGKPMTLVGPEIRVGQQAPDFKLVATDFSGVALSQSRGKVRLLSVVYSLETGICRLQTQKFEEIAGKFKDAVIYTISMDLPFAQSRYSNVNNIKNIRALSDYRDASFGKAYGVLIEEMRLLSRAIFIIDRDDTVRYVEYVSEVARHPDYDKAIETFSTLVNRKT